MKLLAGNSNKLLSNHISNYDFSYKEISKLLKKYPKKLFFIDEAYYGYGCFSSINLTKKFTNIFVARSFSKQFGLTTETDISA